MAAQRGQQQAPQQGQEQQPVSGQSSIEVSFDKGIVTDMDDSFMPQGSYYSAVNATPALPDGTMGGIERGIVIQRAIESTYKDSQGRLSYRSKFFIYLILNKVNNKIYIGSTARGSYRRKEHFKHLRGNRHCNIHLQSAWNKYGGENFVFLIVEWLYFDKDTHWTILSKGIEDKENFYIETLNPEYNLLRTSQIQAGFNMKERMGEERYKEYQKRRVATLMKNGHSERMIAYNKSRVITQETTDKISNSLKGRKVSPEVIEKGLATRKGFKHTEETKRKIKETGIETRKRKRAERTRTGTE